MPGLTAPALSAFTEQRYPVPRKGRASVLYFGSACLIAPFILPNRSGRVKPKVKLFRRAASGRRHQTPRGTEGGWITKGNHISRTAEKRIVTARYNSFGFHGLLNYDMRAIRPCQNPLVVLGQFRPADNLDHDAALVPRIRRALQRFHTPK